MIAGLKDPFDQSRCMIERPQASANQRKPAGVKLSFGCCFWKGLYRDLVPLQCRLASVRQMQKWSLNGKIYFKER